MNKFDFSARKAQLQAIVTIGEGSEDRKSPERKASARAQRKLKLISVVEELLANVKPDTKLSEETMEYLKGLSEVHAGGVKLEIEIGDNLWDLLQRYRDVKDLYKKILKWCDENNAQIIEAEIVAK